MDQSCMWGTKTAELMRESFITMKIRSSERLFRFYNYYIIQIKKERMYE